ncbi:uncharacterized protein N7503_006396 [Penicillium pulvis]|uniref:uncharacterized protein n=1 Tax=Penicillium pulvis TaxID=1562058 RepID=UPI0025470DEE|nr:uncharacterized protein N7503_006396 [Penicillium pulvis]KAJ5798891.1 hypothetical protein N7503_006396 [Penicillium pulvis]
MRTSILFATLSAFALTSGVVAETSSESTVNYLTETNSLGVVTGQPSVVTSQPSAATSQEAAASIPAGLTAPVVTAATGSFTSSVRSSTPLTSTSSGSTATGTSTKSSTSSDSSDSSSSATGSSTSTSTGGAAFATAGMGLAAGAAILAFL